MQNVVRINKYAKHYNYYRGFLKLEEPEVEIPSIGIY